MPLFFQRFFERRLVQASTTLSHAAWCCARSLPKNLRRFCEGAPRARPAPLGGGSYKLEAQNLNYKLDLSAERPTLTRILTRIDSDAPSQCHEAKQPLESARLLRSNWPHMCSLERPQSVARLGSMPLDTVVVLQCSLYFMGWVVSIDEAPERLV